jgi:hypothetical protein
LHFSEAAGAARFQNSEGHPVDGDISESDMCLEKVNNLSAANRPLLPDGLPPFAFSIEVRIGNRSDKDDLLGTRITLLGGCFHDIHFISKKTFKQSQYISPPISAKKGALMSQEKVPRPPVAQGITYKLDHVACDDMFVILNGWKEEGDFEMFLKCGPQGSCSAAIMNALSVLFSYARRSGVPLIAIARLFSRHGGICSKAGDNGKKPCVTALGELLHCLVVEDDDDMAGTPVAMNGSFRTRFTGCGPMMIFIGEDTINTLRYVDVKLARTNTCAHTITSVVSELISLMLGHGIVLSF